MAEFAVLAELTAGVTIQATAAAAVAPMAIRVSLICLAYPSPGTAISNRPAAGNALRVRAHGANGRGPTVAIDCGRKVLPKLGIAVRKVLRRRLGGQLRLRNARVVVARDRCRWGMHSPACATSG